MNPIRTISQSGTLSRASGAGQASPNAAVTDEAKKLLSSLLGSSFGQALQELRTSGSLPSALPSPADRFGGQLGTVQSSLTGLVSGQGTPEKLNALWDLGNRNTGGFSAVVDQVTQENMPYLDERQKANLALQKASQIMSEAAALITTLQKMADQAGNEIIRNMK